MSKGEWKSMVMTESNMCDALRTQLQLLGVPDEVMFPEMEVCTGGRRSYRADFLVSAEDKKTPLFIFEIKENGDRTVAYRNARRQMAGVFGMFPCFVVVCGGGKIYIARISAYEAKNTDWTDIKDNQRFRKMIGDYRSQSEKVISYYSPDPSEKFYRMIKFRDGLIVSGILVILISYILEMTTGKVMSYQLAGLIVLVFVLYAASYGVIKEVKIGDNGVSFHSQK